MYRHNYLIAYDISCSKRRNKVFKRLSEVGFAMQHSVFLLHLNRSKIEQTWSQVTALVDSQQDSIFCVTLNRQGFCETSESQNKGVVLYHDCPMVMKLVS